MRNQQGKLHLFTKVALVLVTLGALTFIGAYFLGQFALKVIRTEDEKLAKAVANFKQPLPPQFTYTAPYKTGDAQQAGIECKGSNQEIYLGQDKTSQDIDPDALISKFASGETAKFTIKERGVLPAAGEEMRYAIGTTPNGATKQGTQIPAFIGFVRREKSGEIPYIYAVQTSGDTFDKKPIQDLLGDIASFN